MPTKQIVAIGGGGFSEESDNPALDDYVLSLVAKERPRVCFVPTASGDADGYIVRFYDAFNGRSCEPSHLALFRRQVSDLREFILSKDIIYVGGGNTANMLAVWRAHDLDAILREAWYQGILLAGVSAGAVCWFEGALTDSFGPGMASLRDGLGLLSGTACPHYDTEPGRRPAYRQLVSRGFPAGIGIDQGAACHFVNGDLHRVVSSRAGARAHRVELRGNEVRESPVDTVYLGRPSE